MDTTEEVAPVFLNSMVKWCCRVASATAGGTRRAVMLTGLAVKRTPVEISKEGAGDHWNMQSPYRSHQTLHSQSPILNLSL